MFFFLPFLTSCLDILLGLKKIREPSHNDLIRQSLMQIRLFNDYVMDISNMLWRKKPFVISPNRHSIFELVAGSNRKLDSLNIDKNSAFSILRHPALIRFAMTCDKTVSLLGFEKKPLMSLKLLFFFLLNRLSFWFRFHLLRANLTSWCLHL